MRQQFQVAYSANDLFHQQLFKERTHGSPLTSPRLRITAMELQVDRNLEIQQAQGKIQRHEQCGR